MNLTCAKFKMAAKVPRWPPKKCQTHFFINLGHPECKKVGFEKSTQNSHENTSVHVLLKQFRYL